MKRISIATIAAGLVALLVAATPQQGQQQGMNHSERMRLVTQMMNDTAAIHMMMDRIASDANLRMTMTDMMLHRMHGDSLSMRGMAGVMLQDPDMHSMMQRMMGGMMTSGGMMSHRAMHGGNSMMAPDSLRPGRHSHLHGAR